MSFPFQPKTKFYPLTEFAQGEGGGGGVCTSKSWGGDAPLGSRNPYHVSD